MGTPFLLRSTLLFLSIFLTACSAQHRRTDSVDILKGLDPPLANGRLPALARPLSYSLSIRVDPSATGFQGHATINLNVLSDTKFLVLHARSLNVSRATLRFGNSPLRSVLRKSAHASVPDELVLVSESLIEKGPVTLELDYDALYDLALSGLYRLKEGESSYAFTQFEATHARQAFPCFDEPSFKVPFNLELVVPKGQKAFANTPVVSVVDSGDKSIFRFAQTKPLPTYLVAFAVGDFDVYNCPPSVIPIRVIATKGKASSGALACETNVALMRMLSDYWSIPYPYEKLDLVAVPEFAAGAMENPGLITFREVLLLPDPRAVSAVQKRWITEVSAHELAHQWFGNLVTLEWWNDLFLNEGFASWMESKVVDGYHPAYRSRLASVSETQDAMDLDALPSARAVRQRVVSTDDAMAAFDGITYTKGSAILGMIEHWIGEDLFRRGVRSYLSAHAHGTATTADLVNSLSSASGRDIGTVAFSFLDRKGVPLVSANLSCENGYGKVNVSQEQWIPAGISSSSNDLPWVIPVCLRLSNSELPFCKVLATQNASWELPGPCPSWIYPNADLAGYYRFGLPEAQIKALAGKTAALSPAERLGLLSNTWALVQAGKLKLEVLLAMLPSLDLETDRFVVQRLVSILTSISETVVDSDSDVAFRSFVSARLLPHFTRLGFPAKKQKTDASSEELSLVRALVIDALARLGNDKEIVRKADDYAREWMRDRSTLDLDTAAYLLPIASFEASRERIAELQKVLKESENPQEQMIVLRALGSFRNPVVLKEALDLVLSKDIKAQDALRIVRGADRLGRPVVYDWIQKSWPALRERLPGSMIVGIVEVLASTCEKGQRERLEDFFLNRSADIEGIRGPLQEASDQAKLCEALHSQEKDSLKTFLANGDSAGRKN